MYTKDGAEYVRRYGTRLEVWDEVVFETAGHLKKDDLEKRKNKIVSKRRSALGKKRFAERNPFKNEQVSQPAAVSEEKRDPVSAPPRKIQRKKRQVKAV